MTFRIVVTSRDVAPPWVRAAWPGPGSPLAQVGGRQTTPGRPRGRSTFDFDSVVSVIPQGQEAGPRPVTIP